VLLARDQQARLGQLLAAQALRDPRVARRVRRELLERSALAALRRALRVEPARVPLRARALGRLSSRRPWA